MPNMRLTKNEMPSQAPDVRNRNFDEVALGYSEEAAVDEAMRCLGCKNMPCVDGCPVNIRIPEFKRLYVVYDLLKACRDSKSATVGNIAEKYVEISNRILFATEEITVCMGLSPTDAVSARTNRIEEAPECNFDAVRKGRGLGPRDRAGSRSG